MRGGSHISGSADSHYPQNNRKLVSPPPTSIRPSVNRIKWDCTQIQYVMRPGLEGTSSLYPLSSMWCECSGLAQRCWQCQGMSETGNMLHPSTCGAPMYLQNRHSRG